MNNIIKSVVREHHWTPAVIDALFFDDIDKDGLMFWYNDIEEQHKELKRKLGK